MWTANGRKPISTEENGLYHSKIHAQGEMADCVRRFPWNATSVGAISDWSEPLLCTVNLLLASQFPEVLVLYLDRPGSKRVAGQLCAGDSDTAT